MIVDINDAANLAPITDFFRNNFKGDTILTWTNILIWTKNRVAFLRSFCLDEGPPCSFFHFAYVRKNSHGKSPSMDRTNGGECSVNHQHSPRRPGPRVVSDAGPPFIVITLPNYSRNPHIAQHCLPEVAAKSRN